MSQLPSKWCSPTLEEIGIYNPKHSKEFDNNLEVSFVPMPNIRDDTWKLNLNLTKKLGQVRKGYTHFSDGDVLFAKITPCMENGKGGIAKGLINSIGCGTTEVHVLRPFAGIEPVYIYSYLHQEKYRKTAIINMTGTAGQLRVPSSYFKQSRIPLPPLNEQRRIVAKLDQISPKVQACQERLDKIPKILKRFRQAILVAACSGRLTTDWRKENPDLEPYPINGKTSGEDIHNNDEFPAKWRTIRLGQLTTLVTSGSRGWAKYYSDSGSIFIRAQNINSDILNLDDIAFVKLPVGAEGLRTKVQQRDILVTITGANVTMSALVERPLEDAYVNQHVALVRLTDERLSRFVFYEIISLSHGRRQLQAAAYGQGKPGLNLGNIRGVVIGLPPLAEAQEIVRRVETLFMLADQIEDRYKIAKANVDKLTQSILAKAFRGELVHQDPKDEPATVLLEKIRNMKAQDQTKKVNRKRPKRRAAAISP